MKQYRRPRPALLLGSALTMIASASPASAATAKPVVAGIAGPVIPKVTLPAIPLPPIVPPAFNGKSVKPVVPVTKGNATKATQPGSIRGSSTGSTSVSPLGGLIEPSWGRIRSFSGDASPFWGRIRSFSGDINPYEGDLSAFWGRIRSFNDGTNYNVLYPEWGRIRSFWGDLGASWGNISASWGRIRSFSETPQEYVALAQQLNGMVTQSQGFWGAAVTLQTGKSFADGFANPLLAKYGINLNDPSSLQNLNPDQREHFFVEWYDGLMEYSGADHVDHWMQEINWTPAITQTLGQGSDSVIGLLDFTVTGDAKSNVTKAGGISTYSTGHGDAVASLMVAAHDGKGVMGIAPKASVVAYNPFDATGTAGWADIKTGVSTLVANKASIVNMSLGVPGMTLDQGWNDKVFADKVLRDAAKNVVFVTAAGNDGIVQTQNIVWNKENPNFIVVGSVDPNGVISAFSNQPGNACLLNVDKCDPGGKLMSRFITAPGEFILVSDGQGGVTRMSGTSFAAPLVSGTIVLIHDRWPWLAKYPKETVDIILKSAKDLGAPGVDAVYGVGELDVTAALSPLDFTKAKFYQYDAKGNLQGKDVKELRDVNKQALWEANSVYYYLMEPVGGTFRDFAVPLSTKLVGQTLLSAGGTNEQFMSYITSRLTDWVRTTRLAAPALFGVTGTDSAVPNAYGMNITMAIAPRQKVWGYRQSSSPYQTAIRLADREGRFALMMGDGDGAVALGGSRGFGFASDYDPAVGGANPLLGFASGGSFAQARLALSERLNVSTNMTSRTLRRDLRGSTLGEQAQFGGIQAYKAGAQQISFGYHLADGVELNAAYTRLHEDSALFGVQSVDRQDFAGGSTTNGMTLGADVSVTPTLSLAASGTFGRTSRGSDRQNIAVSAGGLTTSSFQLAMTKASLLGRDDRLRVTVSQPMHLERGTLDYTTVAVVDRQTGELGSVTQRFDIASRQRQFVAEMLYGRRFLGGAAEAQLFGRANLSGTSTSQLPSVIAGAGMTLGF